MSKQRLCIFEDADGNFEAFIDDKLVNPKNERLLIKGECHLTLDGGRLFKEFQRDKEKIEALEAEVKQLKEE